MTTPEQLDWHDAATDLPNDGQDVLCLDNAGTVFNGHRFGFAWFDDHADPCFEAVLYWAALPMGPGRK